MSRGGYNRGISGRISLHKGIFFFIKMLHISKKQKRKNAEIRKKKFMSGSYNPPTIECFPAC